MTLPFWPNEDDALAVSQSEVDEQDAEALLRGLAGIGVISGCAVTESSPQAQTVDIASGKVMVNGSPVTVSAAADTAITAADATNPRIDAVSVNSSGTVVVTAGTAAAAASLVAPAWPAGNVPLAQIYVDANDNTHANNQIVDKRVTLAAGVRHISTSSITAGTTFDIAIPAGYERIVGYFRSRHDGSAINRTLNIRVGASSTPDTGSVYDWSRHFGGDSTSGSSDDGATAIQVTTAHRPVLGSGVFEIAKGYDDSSAVTHIHGTWGVSDGTTQFRYDWHGTYNTLAVIDVLQLRSETDDFAADGEVVLYGYF